LMALWWPTIHFQRPGTIKSLSVCLRTFLVNRIELSGRFLAYTSIGTAAARLAAAKYLMNERLVFIPNYI